MTRWFQAVFIPALLLVWLSTGRAAAYQDQSILISSVLLSLQQGDLASASIMVAQFRKQNGDTSEAMEALSWVARGELYAGHLSDAMRDAEEVRRVVTAAARNKKLDADPHLATALGAAYEVQATVLDEERQKQKAIQLLSAGLRSWRGTSIETRLKKNLNVLTLEGRPMPPLRAEDWIGQRPSLGALRGKPLLLFFWAHWCADCKAEAPVIAQIATEFEPKGLAVVGPTQFYGYTALDEHAPPAEEKQFIEKAYERFYSMIPNMSVPLDPANFDRFGASTTPTIVLIDRRGIVRLYHPGVMDEASLQAAIKPLIAQPVTRASARTSGR